MLEGAFPANTDAVIVDIQPGTQKRYSGGGTTYATLAAAGIWSTPSDMLKFASSVRGAYLGQKTDWISQAIAQEMFTMRISVNPIGRFGFIRSLFHLLFRPCQFYLK